MADLVGDGWKVFAGSCLDRLRELPDGSVDAVVTDPPYGLSNTDPAHVSDALVRWVSGERDFIPEGKGFMGKAWDAFVPPPAVWDECLRVLKPGGHLLAFAGSRTFDLMALSIRLAGFEIRDSVAWLYGSGFPKSLDVSKAIDKAAGVEREVLTETVSDIFGEREEQQAVTKKNTLARNSGSGEKLQGDRFMAQEMGVSTIAQTAPATPEAQKWQGWGTALKPAFEPVVVARKPLIGTVAENVLAYGTGGLNIDGTRIPSSDTIPQVSGSSVLGGNAEGWDRPWKSDPLAVAAREARAKEAIDKANTLGRWPSNVMLDEFTAGILDEQSGMLKSGDLKPSVKTNPGTAVSIMNSKVRTTVRPGDTGGASRFFFVSDSQKHDRMTKCENTNANNVAKLFSTIRATIESSAQTSVEDCPNELNAQIVKNAEIRCDSCATHIAADLVALKTLATNAETSTHFQAFIAGSKSYTLNQNLASLVEKWGNTGTIPTMTDFLTLFGCALLATDEHIKSESLESDKGRTRFIYQPKASKRDRNEGLDELPEVRHSDREKDDGVGGDNPRNRSNDARQNFHPTVKPTDLMRQLVRLVTPPGGLVLDPFTGSGSTGKAAILEGFEFVGVELTEDYLPIIEGRLSHAVKMRADALAEAEAQEAETLF